MEQMMIVVVAFLSSSLLGLRLTFPGFAPVMLLGMVAAFALQGALVAVLVCAAMQGGYFTGMIFRAFFPARLARPALPRAALR